MASNWAAEYEAPAGQIWICGACGKRARNKATGGLNRLWDEACFLNAVLCYDEDGAGTAEKPWRAVDEESTT